MKIYTILIVALCAFTAACSSQSSTVSPMDTMRALNEAARKKDTATLKSFVSKGTLSMMEENAKRQNSTVDELLKKDSGAPFEELPEMRNEKITGDAATVEVKDKNSEKWVTLPFVKEDGVWKVALDKFIQDAMKQMNEEMKMPAADNSNNQTNK